jgi:hypothetical protein
VRAIALLKQGDQIRLGQLAGGYDDLAAVMDKLRGGLLLMALWL